MFTRRLVRTLWFHISGHMDVAEHAGKLKPELATLDCGTSSAGDSIYVARLSDLREMATLIQDARSIRARVQSQ